MIKAGIIGSTGYAGAELVRLLLSHPEADIVWFGSRSYIDETYSGIFRNLYGLTDALCREDDPETLAKEADVIFTATPQGYCASVMSKELLDRAKVIDLSADFRFKDIAVYEQWYHMEHAAPSFNEEAVYGLVELYRDSIKDARLVANPGCYTTCSILSCYPAVKEGLIEPGTLIVSALSGVSGAGRGAKVDNLFCEVNESAKPYGVATHRHTPEIEEHLTYAAGYSVKVQFTPHLVPMNRGILATCYADLKEGVTKEKVRKVYEDYYAKERFIRILPDGAQADTKWVETSNYTDIALTVDERTGRLIISGALDNLVKGAAGQAVQNMNLMFGLPEETGLTMVPVFP